MNLDKAMPNLSKKLNQAQNFFYRRPYLTMLLVFLLLGAFLFQNLKRLVIYDEVGYKSYLSSLLLDHDLDLSNDCELGRLASWEWDQFAFEQTITGAYDNKFSIGPAILWTPFFILGHLLTHGWNLLGAKIAADGYTLLYDTSLAFEIHLFTILTLFLLYWTGKFYFGSRAALFGAVVIFAGSFWPLYIFRHPLWPHNLTISLAVFFCWTWERYNDRSDFPVWPIALASTFFILVRWQNLLFVIVAMGYSCFKIAHLVWAEQNSRMGLHNFKQLLLWGALALIGVLPQGFVWYFQNGSFLTVPQGVDFLRWTEPEIIPLLFSSWHGLFLTHPLLLLGSIGLFWPGKTQLKHYRVVFIVTFILVTYLNSIVDDWWAGGSLGMRRFDAFIPFMALGLMQVWTSLKRPFMRRAMAIFCVISIILNLNLVSLMVGDLIHSGFPLSQQIDLLQSLWRDALSNPLSLLPRSSPMGDLVLLIQGQSLTTAWLTWLAISILSIGVILILKHLGLRPYRRLNFSAPYYTYLFAFSMAFVTGWIIYAGFNTNFRTMQSLALAKSEFLAGNTVAARTIFNELAGSGRCDVYYLGWRIARTTHDIDLKAAVGSHLLAQCGPPAWLRLAKEIDDQANISALSAGAEQKLVDYAAWHPHQAYILLTLAEAHRKRGHPALAIQYLEGALLAEPDHPIARWELANIYRDLGELERAAYYFRQVRGYMGVYPYANLAEMTAFQGNEPTSLAYLNQARDFQPGDPLGSVVIADFAARSGRYELARIEYEHALQQRPKKTLGHWYPLISLYEGNAWSGLSGIMPSDEQRKMACLAAQSAYAYALDNYRELIELSLAQHNFALAKTMLKDEQFDRAADYLQRSLAALRRKTSIQNNAVKTRLLTVSQLERVPNAAPHLTSIYLPLTYYYHPRTAFHPLPDLAELSAQARANAQTQLGNNAALLARLDMFETQLTPIVLNPDNETKVAALTALGTTLAEILSDLNPYIYWWTPKDIGEVYINQARALQCLDRVQEADQVLLEASQRYPENAYVFLNRALLQATNDNPHEAETSFRQAIECEPGNYWVHFDYARFLTDQGDYELAQVEISKAIAIAPGKAMGYNQLGHILYKAGKPDAATQAYHQAMALEPGWYAMFGGAITLVTELRLPLQIVNPTGSPYVYTYVWSDNQVQRYLLDDSSKQGKKYEIEWLIQPQKIWLQGEYQAQESTIAALSDQQPLAVAVSFQNGPDSSTSNIYERRYRFKLLDNNQLEIMLPPETWHNPRYPEATWEMVNIDQVMTDDLR